MTTGMLLGVRTTEEVIYVPATNEAGDNQKCIISVQLDSASNVSANMVAYGGLADVCEKHLPKGREIDGIYNIGYTKEEGIDLELIKIVLGPKH